MIKIAGWTSIIIYTTGIVLLANSFYKSGFISLLDSGFYIVYIILFLCILLGTWCWTNKNVKIYGKRISSLLTPMYSIFLPIIPLVLFIRGLISIFVENQYGNLSDRIIISVFFLMLLLIQNKYRRLKIVYFTQHELFNTSMFNCSSYTFSQIKDIKKYNRYLYKIEVQNNDSIYDLVFMPRIKDSVNMLEEPKSIQKIRSLIRKK